MSLKEAFSRQDVMKVLKFSVMLGGGFGVATVLTYSLLLSPVPLPLHWMVVVPLAAASISTLAGMTGILLDWLLGRRLADPGLRRLVTFALVAIVVIGGVGIFIVRVGGEVKRHYFWGAAVGSLLGAAVSFLDYRLGEMRRRMADLEKENRLLAEIAEKDRELEEAIRTLAVAEERNRMARELHDSISQGIHGLIYALRSLRPHLPPDDRRAGEILEHLERTAEATLEELRAMIMELKPSTLREHGLAGALRLQAELFARRHRLELALDLAPVAGLTSAQETAVYRIAQEALNNVGRHAGATMVRLSLSSEGRLARLRVEDNGGGFAPGEAQELEITAAGIPPELPAKLCALPGVDRVLPREDGLLILTGAAEETLAGAFTGAKAAVSRIEIRRPNLETLFMKITGRSLRD